MEDIYENEGSQNAKVLTDGKISKDLADVVETMWAKQNAVITIDLGENVSKYLIDEIILAFKADNTNATAYNVQFSSDGIHYEKVLDKTEVTYAEALEDKVDAVSYTHLEVYKRQTFMGADRYMSLGTMQSKDQMLSLIHI